ncbi:MAG: S24 family peptidase, partial [Armatimonadota bacterium]|nr:S24 family peptidase [Armatimonadota bacterium]
EVIAPYDYSVRVRGDSMAGVLNDGDIAFVKAQDHAAPGDLVVALVRDEAVVKRLVRRSNGLTLLRSENDHYEEIPATEVRILGVVTGLYRRP